VIKEIEEEALVLYCSSLFKELVQTERLNFATPHTRNSTLPTIGGNEHP